MSRETHTSSSRAGWALPAAVGCCFSAVIVLLCLVVGSPNVHASAVVGTYFEDQYLIADGTTVYRFWVYVDNTGLGGSITDFVGYSPVPPAFITQVPAAYARAPADRDFFEGKILFDSSIVPLGQPSYQLTELFEGSANKFGDLQWYDITVDVGAPIGPHEIGFNPIFTFLRDPDPDAPNQPYIVQNQPFFVIPSVPGDTDVDGEVDLDDYNTLSSHYGQTGVTWFDGDFDLDNDVDFEDFVKLALNFGYVAPESLPTPATGVLLLAAFAFTCRRARS